MLRKRSCRACIRLAAILCRSRELRFNRSPERWTKESACGQTAGHPYVPCGEEALGFSACGNIDVLFTCAGKQPAGMGRTLCIESAARYI
jgi:hypothetical protein